MEKESAVCFTGKKENTQPKDKADPGLYCVSSHYQQMSAADRIVCSLAEDFGISVAGTAALTQITVPICVLQLCGNLVTF